MRRLLFAEMLALGVAGCGEPVRPPAPPSAVATITVSPATATVAAGDTVRLTATLTDAAGTVLAGRSVAWSSDSAGVATVSPVGLARGINPGSVTIRASSEGTVGTALIVVTPVGFTRISAGGSHACAIARDNRAYCWGYNLYGQVGIGTFAFLQTTPAPVAGRLAFRAISAGTSHTCGLTTDSAAYCWGRNSAGQLGRGVGGNSSVPGRILGALKFIAVSAGGEHSCGLAADSLVYCWGLNLSGQLGDGSTTSRPTPVRVAGTFRFQTLSAGGDHTCGITTNGTAYCWGANAAGQVGDSSSTNRPAPVPVAGRLAFTGLSAGREHTCAIAISGTLYCWGRNTSAQLGSGLADSTLRAPVAVSGGLTFRSAAAGVAHTCGLAADSLAYCWGANPVGQLGDSSTTDRATPVAVAGGLRFAAVSAGALYTCAMTTGTLAYCWGFGGDAALGTGSLDNRLAPTRVAGQP